MSLYQYIKKIAIKILKIDKQYISKVENEKGWVYISYIPDVFYKKSDKKFMNGHQSRREMLAMVEIFNKIGYNVYVGNHVLAHIPRKKFKLIFGLEPSFVYACKKNPNAIKVYYATGAFYGHQNKMVKGRTDHFNRIHNSDVICQRLVKDYHQLDIADAILQIGTKNTIETYPTEYRKKITLINQSSIDITDLDIHPTFSHKNEYIWLGGGGSILKGLDLVLDYFIQHPENILNIVGTVDKDFLASYDNIGSNIKFHGFMNILSSKFLDITKRCNFMIFPSCSEGGCPGSVINAMKFGLIPLVTRWAAPDYISEVGYCISDLSSMAISEAIRWSINLSSEQIIELKQKCMLLSKNTYNINRFNSEFESYFREILK